MKFWDAGHPHLLGFPSIAETLAMIVLAAGGVAVGGQARVLQSPAQLSVGKTLVQRLDYERFKANIKKLAGFGTRFYSSQGNVEARDWLQKELESYGYTVDRHRFRVILTLQGQPFEKEIDSVYATKIGDRHPDQMYIVSGHMDSINFDSPDQSFAPGADDDASGSSLVLDSARVFAAQDVRTEYSIRFMFWNAEEILAGSRAYVQDRNALQGKQSPPGSGKYPEPTWLGMIQHDMVLFDHGMPPGPTQSVNADIDIEYQAAADADGKSRQLAATWRASNMKYSGTFPTTVGPNMAGTDSIFFAPYCPSISVRENQRVAGIEQGSNPHHHKGTDVYETYKDEDFRLGFSALQMTVGAVSELAVASGPKGN